MNGHRERLRRVEQQLGPEPTEATIDEMLDFCTRHLQAEVDYWDGRGGALMDAETRREVDSRLDWLTLHLGEPPD